MFSYSELIAERSLEEGMEKGMEKGMEEGIKKSRVEYIKLIANKMHYSYAEAMDFLEIPQNDQKLYTTYFDQR